MTHIFGLIAFLVLLVSVSSVFVESAYAAEADAIAVILGITFENIKESFADAGIDPEGDPVFVAAHEEYLEALAALDAGDIVIAEASALQAMALFEESAENIGELEDQTSTQFPSGLGTAAASIFNVQEGITNSVNEAGELHKLIQSNDLDIDLGEFDEYVNLAKTLLAEGVVPDAQAQLDLANQIKTELYAEIQDAANNISVSGIQDALDNQENLGLTKKEIRELEEMAEDLSSEDSSAPGNSGDAPGQENKDSPPGNSGDAPGQENKDSPPGNSGDAPGQSGENAPGNSGDAPGQNKDNESELPPGFGAAGDNPSAEGVANGIGLGLGGENIPPGQLKKLGYSFGYDQSPDDYYESHYEASIDDDYAGTYDGTNKAHDNGKGKFGASPLKSGAPGSFNADIKSDGKKPFCAGKDLGGIPIIILPDAVVVLGLGEGFIDPVRACDVGIVELTGEIVVSGDTLNVDASGVYNITYDVTSLKSGNSATPVTRTIGVGEFAPIFEVLVDRPAPVFQLVSTSDFETSIVPGGNPDDDVYQEGAIQNIFDNGSGNSSVIVYLDSGLNVISSFDNTTPADGTYFVEYTVTDGITPTPLLQ